MWLSPAKKFLSAVAQLIHGNRHASDRFLRAQEGSSTHTGGRDEILASGGCSYCRSGGLQSGIGAIEQRHIAAARSSGEEQREAAGEKSRSETRKYRAPRPREPRRIRKTDRICTADGATGFDSANNEISSRLCGNCAGLQGDTDCGAGCLDVDRRLRRRVRRLRMGNFLPAGEKRRSEQRSRKRGQNSGRGCGRTRPGENCRPAPPAVWGRASTLVETREAPPA